MTFGQLLATARKQAGLSQKDLAARIRKEDGTPISPQYLNDLERDRRNAPSEFLLKQFAHELQLPEDYVFFVAGQYPEDVLAAGAPHPPDTIQAAFQAFRKVLRGEQA